MQKRESIWAWLQQRKLYQFYWAAQQVLSSTIAATDLLPALSAALLLGNSFLFPIPKCLKLLVVIKTQAFFLSDMSIEGTWGTDKWGILLFGKRVGERGKKSKGKVAFKLHLPATHQLFFILGGGVGFAQISCSELLELVRNQEST